jgi:transposase
VKPVADLVGVAEATSADLGFEASDLVSGEFARVALVMQSAESFESLIAKDTEPFAQLGKTDAQEFGDLFTGFAISNGQDGGEALVDPAIKRPLASPFYFLALLCRQDYRFHGRLCGLSLACSRLPHSQSSCIVLAGSPSATVYSSGGVKDLFKRVGISYHKVTGFLWKADPDKQEAFVKKYRRQKANAQRQEAGHTRRYFVDACHPVWGLSLVFSCWLLLGQRLLVGMGGGRKRLNILGAYCPDDQEYLDIRLTRDNINGEQFVNLLRLLRERHPETKRFILYLDNAAYYGKPVVLEWLARHREFSLEPVPPYSPNVNLIERLWKLMKQKALGRWHQTFESMEQAISCVLDHLDEYQEELATLMVDEFHIIPKQEIPVQYQGVA